MAYKDAVDRFLGKKVDLRFVEAKPVGLVRNPPLFAWELECLVGLDRAFGTGGFVHVFGLFLFVGLKPFF